MGLGRAINIGAAVGCGENVLSRETPTPLPLQFNPPGAPADRTSGRGFGGVESPRAGGAMTSLCHLDFSANRIPSISRLIGLTNQLSASAAAPFKSRAHGSPSEFLLAVQDVRLLLSPPQHGSGGSSGSHGRWGWTMGHPWAAASAEGAPTRLPLVLTALWAAVVGLELAYVLVLGPGPPPLGPLARALQLALAAFQLLNLLGNVGLFLRSDPSIRGVMLAGRGLGQGWAYCYQCQSQVPPRSGHCSACRICILRRDHHCRLLGRCVGFRNYRPFLCLLLHGAGVLLHVSVLLGPALSALLRAHSLLHTAALLLLPWLMLLTGRVSLAQFTLAFVMDTCVAGALLCGAGLLFHGMLLLRGQTTWEWARGQHSYDLGPCHNLQAALGPRWALVWLWPFLASPLPGDGITFHTTAEVGLTTS